MFRNAISRSTLGLALVAGILTVGVSAPALAQRGGGKQQQGPALSPAFTKAAAPFQKAVQDAKARPNVVAAKGNPAALTAALAPEAAQVDAVVAAATTPADKSAAGGLVVTLGQLAEDNALLKRGLTLMIESGTAANTPQLQFFLGQTNYSLKDYAGAQVALQAAVAGGYRDNDVEALLAQAYITGGKPAEGLAVLRKAIDAKQAAGGVAPESWYRVGTGSAYKVKQLDQAAFFSSNLVRGYPTKDNWALAISVLRDAARYQAQESLDMMRLMNRTGSYSESRDYVDHIQVADARRFPGEVVKVIELGTASGKLPANDPFVAEARTIATGRIAADRASLPALDRDAHAPTATLATIAAAADTFLSYGDAAKAENLYTLALTKPGGDAARLQTRLGIAQVDKGDYAAAQATFAKVTGPRQPLAQLWGTYAAQKAAGK
jgi:tetratricopeptide (TPR) repeat protein